MDSSDEKEYNDGEVNFSFRPVTESFEENEENLSEDVVPAQPKVKKTSERLEKLREYYAQLGQVREDMEAELIGCEKYTTTTINASQTFIKSNPLLKDYRDTVKSYQTVLKQLCDLTKDEKNPVEKDELEQFLSK